jgi:anti-anti-sigma factor
MAIDDGGTSAKATTSIDANGTTIISIAGEVDISNVNDIERDCTEAVRASPERIVFDLAGLGFMDSSGLAMLLRINELVDHLSIRDASPAMRRIVEATGLAEQLHLEP